MQFDYFENALFLVFSGELGFMMEERLKVFRQDARIDISAKAARKKAGTEVSNLKILVKNILEKEFDFMTKATNSLGAKYGPALLNLKKVCLLIGVDVIIDSAL